MKPDFLTKPTGVMKPNPVHLSGRRWTTSCLETSKAAFYYRAVSGGQRSNHGAIWRSRSNWLVGQTRAAFVT
jgi:hypothetical protein